MYKGMPPLNGLRAFEAAARHLSLTKAAGELHVSVSALSHQIRALEALLGVPLFERRVRSIALTPHGQRLFPKLRLGFSHIRDAVDELRELGETRVLVISTPPGFTAKWLAGRLYRFSAAHPEIDPRVSSSLAFANFKTDGVDVGVRTLPIDAGSSPDLAVEKLIDINLLPVCSPRLIETHGAITKPVSMKRLPLIHDDSRAPKPSWADWFEAAGVGEVDLSRGLRFNSADHALDTAIEGGGVLLAYDVLAYDDLRTGRLVAPIELSLSSGRAYYVVCAKSRQDHANVKAFKDWVKREIDAMDWGSAADRIRRRKSASARARPR